MAKAARGVVLAALCLAVFNCAWGAGNKGSAQWGYQGADGPEHWGESYPQCGIGKSQSPIDISGPLIRVSTPIKLVYRESALRILDNGHTIQLNVDAGSFMRIGEQRYELLQFHFHRPSEERVEGKLKAMVAHFVHRSEGGKLAVVGVLMEDGGANPLIATLWANLPKEAGQEITVPAVKINAAAFLPSSLEYYQFMGSLTTPPCSEGVAFYILKHAVPVSKAQIEAFPYAMNARPVQPLNGRQIMESGK